MEVVLILVGLFVAYELLVAKASTSTVAVTTPTPAPPAPGSSTAGVPPTPATPQQPAGVQLPGYTVSTGGGGPSTAETTSAAGIGAGLNFIPVAGPAISAVFGVIVGGLLQASAKRAAAARNENQAVAAAVPGWDSGMAQTVNAYNSGQITLSQVYQLIAAPQVTDSTVPNSQGILWTNYWKECGPQIQAGRNGCQSGTVVCPPGQSFCQGSYGASCCVGYNDLMNSSVYAMRAAKLADANPGVPQTSQMFPTVFASKYGGINRNGYTVTFKKPVPATSSVIPL